MPLIVDNNKVIKTSIEDIIYLLKQQLDVDRIDKLSSIEIKQNNIRVTCPIHGGGHERTPSCDILMTDKGSTPAGTVFCFACGYKTNLVRFVADCLNKNYREATEWLLNICDYSYLEDTRDVSQLNIVDKFNSSSGSNISIEELKKYDYIHPYMFKRKLTDEVIKKYEVGYDPELDAITFPVYVDGVCKFVCKRRVKFKRFDMPEIDEKPIYGLDYVTGSSVVVCESIINALTAVSYGYSAVALFGTGSSKQYEKFNKLGIRHIVLCFDGDEAGRKGAKRFIDNVKYSIIDVIELPNGKDLNDLTKEQFDDLYNKAINIGIDA